MKGVLRPAQTVMPDSALTSEPVVVSPPPNHFTHVVRAKQAYFAGATLTGEPAGTLPAGTKVVLMIRGKGDVARVIDRRGRYMATSFKGLRALA